MNRIRIRLKAYDHILLDKSMNKIVKTAKNTGAFGATFIFSSCELRKASKT